MNQTIKHLYVIALLETEGEEEMVETFAELIIKECVSLALQNNNSGEGAVIAETINKHFLLEQY